MQLVLLQIFGLMAALPVINPPPANTLAIYTVTSDIPIFYYPSGEHHLYFNRDSAAFINADYPVDSWVKGGGQKIQAMIGDPDRRLCLTTLSDSTVRWKTNYGGNRDNGIWSILADPYPRIDWRATGASRTNTLGQTCLEAKGTFGGRDYTAWYVPSVPTRFGPWMLHGLPGLVDELTSADGMIHVKLTNVSTTRSAIPTYTNGVPRTYGELRREVIKNVLATEALVAGSGGTVLTNDPCSACEIELDKWSFIKEYKLAEIKAGRRKRQPGDKLD